MYQNYSILWLLIFILQILVISYSSKNLFNNLYVYLYKLFKKEKTVVYIISFIFLPGTFIHELSHAISTVLLGGRVSRFSVWPKVEDGHIKMGYAEVEVLDIFRNTIIGISPLIVGVSILYYVSLVFESSTIYWQIFFVYLVFQIANSMFLSASDVREFKLLLYIVLSILVFLYVYNFYFYKLNFLPQNLEFLKTSVYLKEIKEIVKLFIFPMLLNIIFFFISKLTAQHR